MKTIRLNSWSEFEDNIRALKDQLALLKKQKGVTYVSDLLFRGQSDSSWGLNSTLDRSLNFCEMSLPTYHEIVREASSKISATLKKFSELQQNTQIRSFQDFIAGNGSYEWIACMAYLRHHGFPSPLIDWTTSLDVAAYFAFCERSNTKYVSVYSFIEYYGNGKSGWVAEPQIHGIGPNLVVHPRHERQSSQYTMCMKKIDHDFYYTSHEHAFNLELENQDMLTKYEIPSNERKSVLRHLAEKNITTHYLFGESEDSLIKDLSFELVDGRL